MKIDVLYKIAPVSAGSYACNTSIPLAVKYVTLPHDWAEFGVSKGISTKCILNFLPKDTKLFLFDSFKGLPESWLGPDNRMRQIGAYKCPPPDFDDERIIWYIGMFEDVIPSFVGFQDKPLAFIHIDCDIYSSTKTIFDNINELIVPGTVILFDEYYNYSDWKKHEYKAFTEWVDKNDREFSYLGRTNKTQAWLVITK